MANTRANKSKIKSNGRSAIEASQAGKIISPFQENEVTDVKNATADLGLDPTSETLEEIRRVNKSYEAARSYGKRPGWVK